ncbi:hypothetical protein E1162_07800 [Rhodobacteraceae bacterium RKSG542]|nr:hypothetical protein [Pseudovibrio flavus]MTI17143.1 hypothetical protein [Pseudovibrio flavus]
MGLAVALLFLVFGLDKVEEAARGAYLFRLQIIPGLVLLWPLVIYHWRSASRSISEDADAT